MIVKFAVNHHRNEIAGTYSNQMQRIDSCKLSEGFYNLFLEGGVVFILVVLTFELTCQYNVENKWNH